MLLGASTVTVTPQTGAWADGEWTSSAGASYTVTATIVPIGQEDLQRLPEAARASARWMMYVEGSPSLSMGGGSSAADRVTWQGRELVVVGIIDYSMHATGLPHKAYILAEVGDDE